MKDGSSSDGGDRRSSSALLETPTLATLATLAQNSDVNATVELSVIVEVQPKLLRDVI